LPLSRPIGFVRTPATADGAAADGDADGLGRVVSAAGVAFALTAAGGVELGPGRSDAHAQTKQVKKTASALGDRIGRRLGTGSRCDSDWGIR